LTERLWDWEARDHQAIDGPQLREGVGLSDRSRLITSSRSRRT